MGLSMCGIVALASLWNSSWCGIVEFVCGRYGMYQAQRTGINHSVCVSIWVVCLSCFCCAGNRESKASFWHHCGVTQCPISGSHAPAQPSVPLCRGLPALFFLCFFVVFLFSPGASDGCCCVPGRPCGECASAWDLASSLNSSKYLDHMHFQTCRMMT